MNEFLSILESQGEVRISTYGIITGNIHPYLCNMAFLTGWASRLHLA
jgi:hypothetical protein